MSIISSIGMLVKKELTSRLPIKNSESCLIFPQQRQMSLLSYTWPGLNWRSLKPVGTRPGIMYGLCKVHKDSINNSLAFWPISSVINTPTYKLAKFFVPILKIVTNNDYMVKAHLLLLTKLLNRILNFLWEAYMMTLFLLTPHLKRLLTSALIHFLKIQKK